MVNSEEGVPLNHGHHKDKVNTVVSKYQNMYEIPLDLKNHKSKALQFYKHLGSSKKNIQLVYVIDYQENETEQRINQMIDYFKGIFPDEYQYKKSIGEIAVVFSKIWEHNKCKVSSIMKLYANKLHHCPVYFFQMDGRFDDSFSKLKGS